MSAIKHPALDLICREGIYGLGGSEGCPCTHFFVRGLHVDVSCRKSNGGLRAIDPNFYGAVVRLYVQSLDAVPGAALREVAEEIVRQLRADDVASAVAVRYCDYEHDTKLKCTYCGEPRESPADYLCPKCKSGTDPFGEPIAEGRDYSSFDLRYPEASGP